MYISFSIIVFLQGVLCIFPFHVHVYIWASDEYKCYSYIVSEPNPLTDFKGNLVMLAVIEVFVLPLSLLQSLAYLQQELITLL
jgi:hypothetical protein